jgi:hypothetical protein
MRALLHKSCRGDSRIARLRVSKIINVARLLHFERRAIRESPLQGFPKATFCYLCSNDCRPEGDHSRPCYLCSNVCQLERDHSQRKEASEPTFACERGLSLTTYRGLSAVSRLWDLGCYNRLDKSLTKTASPVVFSRIIGIMPNLTTNYPMLLLIK